MFHTLRKARFGRAALTLAGFLAIMSSFGLHPEPAQSASLPAAGSLPAWSLDQSPGQTSHDCLACLAHRWVSLTRLAGVILQPGTSVAAALAPREAFSRRAWRPDHEGRAPPPLG
jgi:hypothetical protein